MSAACGAGIEATKTFRPSGNSGASNMDIVVLVLVIRNLLLCYKELVSYLQEDERKTRIQTKVH